MADDVIFIDLIGIKQCGNCKYYAPETEADKYGETVPGNCTREELAYNLHTNFRPPSPEFGCVLHQEEGP